MIIIALTVIIMNSFTVFLICIIPIVICFLQLSKSVNQENNTSKELDKANFLNKTNLFEYSTNVAKDTGYDEIVKIVQNSVNENEKYLFKSSLLINLNIDVAKDKLIEILELNSELKDKINTKTFNNKKQAIIVNILKNHYILSSDIVTLYTLEESSNSDYNMTRVTMYVNIKNVLKVSNKSKSILTKNLNFFYNFLNELNLYVINATYKFVTKDNVEEMVRKNKLNAKKFEKINAILGLNKEDEQIDNNLTMENDDKRRLSIIDEKVSQEGLSLDNSFIAKSLEKDKNKEKEKEKESEKTINSGLETLAEPSNVELKEPDVITQENKNEVDFTLEGLSTEDLKIANISNEARNNFETNYKNCKWVEWEKDSKTNFESFMFDDDKSRRHIKAVAIVNKSKEALFEYLQILDNKIKFDKSFEKGEIERECNEHFSLLRLQYKGKLGVSPREFKIIVKKQSTSEDAEIFACSNPSDKSPDTKGVVRANLVYSYYYLNKLSPSSTRIEFYCLSETGLSQWLVNLVLKDLTHTLKEIKKLNEKK